MHFYTIPKATNQPPRPNPRHHRHLAHHNDIQLPGGYIASTFLLGEQVGQLVDQCTNSIVRVSFVTSIAVFIIYHEIAMTSNLQGHDVLR